MACQERAPKRPHHSETRVPAQKQSPPADTCVAGGRGGGVPLIPNLKRTEVLSHPHWFVDIHLWCKKLDYRPWGKNVKIHKPPHAAKSAWSVLQQIWKGGKPGRGGESWDGEQKPRERPGAWSSFPRSQVLNFLSYIPLPQNSFLQLTQQVYPCSHIAVTGIKSEAKFKSFKS